VRYNQVTDRQGRRSHEADKRVVDKNVAQYFLEVPGVVLLYRQPRQIRTPAVHPDPDSDFSHHLDLGLDRIV